MTSDVNWALVKEDLENRMLRFLIVKGCLEILGNLYWCSKWGGLAVDWRR